jgi:hypothetical protein
MADLRKNSMDGPTLALAVVVVGLAVPTMLVALTGIGVAGAFIAIAISASLVGRISRLPCSQLLSRCWHFRSPTVLV